VQAIQEKYQGSDDPTFRERAIQMKGAALRTGEAPPVDAVDRLLQAPAPREVPEAARAVQHRHQEGGRRRGRRQASNDPVIGQELLDCIAQSDKIFWETRQAA
jgi:nickel superoxide dismutase